MLKSLLAVSAFALCFADTVAQEAPPLPAVDTMSCEQMTAEIATAGALMNSQLDPEFAREAQAMHDEAQGASRGQGRQLNREEAAAAVEANQARINAQNQRLENAMAGIDQNRMMALMQRFESERCPTPQ